MNRLLILIFFGLILYSCSPTRFYKPLEKGEKAVTASLGGPLINVPNMATIPIPFTTIGYGQGVTDDLTIYGAWHTTSSIFGVAHIDFGSTYRLWKNDKMGVSTAIGGNFLIDVFEWNPSFYPQISANYYYRYKNVESKQLIFDLYIGTENWIDLRSNKAHNVHNTIRWLWNMHLGHSVSKNLWSYQFEEKLLAPYLNNDVVVDYISPLRDKGAVGIYFGVQRLIGKK